MEHEKAFNLVSEICPEQAGKLWNTTNHSACDTAWAVSDQYEEGEIAEARRDLKILSSGKTPPGWEPHNQRRIEMSNANLTIEAETASGSMGDGWIDDHAANEAYAEWLEDQLTEWAEARFEDLNVSVCVRAVNQWGCQDPSVYGDIEDPELIQQEVRDFMCDMWQKFCELASGEFSHLVDG